MMWNTELLRGELVQRATDAEVSSILCGFCEQTDGAHKELAAAMRKATNWRRMYKRRENGMIERVFNCAPLDDQLRAYVYTDLGDSNIVDVRFETE